MLLFRRLMMTSHMAAEANMKAAAALMPVLFLSHGGGPSFFMNVPKGHPMYNIGPDSDAAKYLKSKLVKESELKSQWPPSALLVISAHWEESKVTALASEAPPLLYDYHGFPPETYKLQWSAPGSPSLSARIQSLLKGAGIPSAVNTKRGLDHGVFIPLKLVVPEANIPTVQLSLHSSLDKEFHLRLGAALAPLRKEGVLIVGSGYATHNLQEFFSAQGGTPAWANTFGQWLEKTMIKSSPEDRVRSLLNIESAAPGGSFRKAHPREEHFTPLLVAVGAGAPEAVKAVLDGNSGNSTGANATASVSSVGDSAVLPVGAGASGGPGSDGRPEGRCRQLFYDMSPGGALMAHYLLT